MKKLMVLLLIISMLFIVVACNNNESAADDQEPGLADQPQDNQEEQPSWMANYTEDMKNVSLNVYSVSDITHILAAFTEDTGIKAEVLQMTNGEILQRIKNEKDSGNVLADVWYRGGADAFVDAAQGGYFMSYESHEAEYFADYTKDENNYWIGTTMTLVGFVVNTEVLEDIGVEVPQKWDDLLNPDLKGLVSMPDPAISGTAYNTVSAILQTRGEDAGWEYLEKLIDQVPFFTPRGSDPTNFTVAGESAVGVIAAFGERQMRGDHNPSIQLVYPQDGTGWWPQPLAILDGAKNVEASKVLVDWILSEEGMKKISEMDDVLALREGLEVPEHLYKLEDVTLFPTDFQANALERDSILSKWEEKISAAGH